MGATKKSAPKKAALTPKAELPILPFAKPLAWATWLAKHHAASRGIWMKIGKKGNDASSITYHEAIQVALAWGWIDGQRGSFDDAWFVQKFTPRTAKSIWSKINRDKALALIEAGEMKPAGLDEVERAKKNGRWEGAYDSSRTATVPADLAAAFIANPRAGAFFATLSSQNRYAVLFRIQTAKTPGTRAKRLALCVGMLVKHETFHPPSRPAK